MRVGPVAPRGVPVTSHVLLGEAAAMVGLEEPAPLVCGEVYEWATADDALAAAGLDVGQAP